MRPVGWFCAWFVIGVAYALALLGALTIGIFVLPFALVATFLLARHRGADKGLPGLVSGAGVPLLYVAYLNRDGPGTICKAISSGQQCIEEWSPWPWFVAGSLVMFAGVAIAVLRARRHAS